MNAKDIDSVELHEPVAGEAYRSVTVYAASGKPLHGTMVSDKEGADAVRDWAMLLLKAADAVDPPEEESEGWRPIETAPEGKSVLLAFGWVGHGYAVGYLDADDDEWRHHRTLKLIGLIPTHWMPLPTPPEEEPSVDKEGSARPNPESGQKAPATGGSTPGSVTW